ncbi:MAG TPA: methylenetetrahydrofolate reductase [Xanthobacteraceae bacterium]|nr:methylenetetrahydrofolate reductase [Xanthobacteraceae bacterium]
MTETAATSASHLETVLKAGRFALTSEITPPLSCDPQALLAKGLPLKGLADAVNVTDGASAKTHLSALVSAMLLKQNGIEPILQFTCRDRNRIALQSDLIGAAALGIHNLLLLTGDDPKAGDQPDTKPVFDVDSSGLTKMARDIRDKGELPNGRKIGGTAHFLLGGADAPIDPKPDWQPTKLVAKVEAGVGFVQTQFCMDAGVARRYLARLAENPVTRDLKVLIGIAPLRSSKSARWMKENLFGTIIPDAYVERLDAAADPVAEGRAIAIDLIEELAGVPGVSGVHIMAPANEASVPPVIEEARKRLGSRASA